MNRMTEATEEEETFGRGEIQVYKELRDQFNRGKVYHLIAPNDEGGIDALQSHDRSKDRSVLVVTREGGAEDVAQLRVKGLSPDRVYRVHFQDDSRVLVESGLTLMTTGVPMYFGLFQASEIVYVEPAVPVAEAPARAGRSGSRPVTPRVRR
jgi:alpha-galactosidase